MSGGSYNYAYRHIEDLAADIRERGGCGPEYSESQLRRAFKSHLAKVAAACRAIEWNDSGDGDSAESEKIRACLPETAELDAAIEQAGEAQWELIAALERAVKR